MHARRQASPRPCCAALCCAVQDNDKLRSLRSSKIGKLSQFVGTVTRTTEVGGWAGGRAGGWVGGWVRSPRARLPELAPAGGGGCECRVGGFKGRGMGGPVVPAPARPWPSTAVAAPAPGQGKRRPPDSGTPSPTAPTHPPTRLTPACPCLPSHPHCPVRPAPPRPGPPPGQVRPELFLGTFRCMECGTLARGVEQQFKYTLPTICSNATCSNKCAPRCTRCAPHSAARCACCAL